MTAKLISLTGLLLMLSSPVFAADAESAVEAQRAPEPDRTAQAPQQPQRLAWQRVGKPLSMES